MFAHNVRTLTKETEDGPRYAVEFEHSSPRNGLDPMLMRSLWVSSKTEADTWRRITRQTGWCVSARYLRAFRTEQEARDYLQPHKPNGADA